MSDIMLMLHFGLTVQPTTAGVTADLLYLLAIPVKVLVLCFLGLFFFF